jgi:hypothetical protein
MLHVSVKFCGKLLLLIFLFLCVSRPASALLKSSTEAGSSEQQAAISDKQPAAISDIGRQAMAQNAPGGKSKQNSFISTEIEPLLLLIFGLLLFSVATGVKLKLSKR